MVVMRSIRETARIFKEMDPETQITEATLRKMIAEGTIPAVKTGVKYLLNVNLILDMLEGSKNNESGKINIRRNEIVIEK